MRAYRQSEEPAVPEIKVDWHRQGNDVVVVLRRAGIVVRRWRVRLDDDGAPASLVSLWRSPAGFDTRASGWQ